MIRYIVCIYLLTRYVVNTLDKEPNLGFIVAKELINTYSKSQQTKIVMHFKFDVLHKENIDLLKNLTKIMKTAVYTDDYLSSNGYSTILRNLIKKSTDLSDILDYYNYFIKDFHGVDNTTYTGCQQTVSGPTSTAYIKLITEIAQVITTLPTNITKQDIKSNTDIFNTVSDIFTYIKIQLQTYVTTVQDFIHLLEDTKRHMVSTELIMLLRLSNCDVPGDFEQLYIQGCSKNKEAFICQINIIEMSGHEQYFLTTTIPYFDHILTLPDIFMSTVDTKLYHGTYGQNERTNYYYCNIQLQTDTCTTAIIANNMLDVIKHCKFEKLHNTEIPKPVYNGILFSTPEKINLTYINDSIIEKYHPSMDDVPFLIKYNSKISYSINNISYMYTPVINSSAFSTTQAGGNKIVVTRFTSLELKLLNSSFLPQPHWFIDIDTYKEPEVYLPLILVTFILGLLSTCAYNCRGRIMTKIHKIKGKKSGRKLRETPPPRELRKFLQAEYKK